MVFMLMFLNLEHFLFLFSNKMLVIRHGIHKMLVRIANEKTMIRQLLHKQSARGLYSLTRPFRQVNSVRNFKPLPDYIWINLFIIHAHTDIQ